jgi:hypothetical protein
MRRCAGYPPRLPHPPAFIPSPPPLLNATNQDIRKRINAIPPLGAKAQLVAIPSTSGTGSEVTPFAVVTDHTTGIKYPLADYSLTPNMAICDANLVMEMPRKLTAYGGLDALVHAMESYVSSVATDYTRGEWRSLLLGGGLGRQGLGCGRIRLYPGGVEGVAVYD